jgi:hypothetical protein
MARYSFEDKLKAGLEFERGPATTILHRLFPTCIIKRYAKDPTESNGPRAFLGDSKQTQLVLPDFEIYDPVSNMRFFVDAKLKNQFYKSMTVKKPKEFYLTLDVKSNKQYSHTMSFFPDYLYLLYGVEANRKVYLTKWQSNPETIYFNNKYGSGDTPIYYHNDLTQVGVF